MTDERYPLETMRWYADDPPAAGEQIYRFVPESRIAHLESIVAAKFRQIDHAIMFLLVALFAAVGVILAFVLWLAAQIPT